MFWKPEMGRAEAPLLQKAMNRDTTGINSIYYHSNQNGPNPVTCQWAPRLAWSYSETLMSPKTASSDGFWSAQDQLWPGVMTTLPQAWG